MLPLMSQGRHLSEIAAELRRQTELLQANFELLLECEQRGQDLTPVIEIVRRQASQLLSEVSCIQEAVGTTVADELAASVNPDGTC